MQTTPLAKAVTTLEGQLVLASNVVLALGAVDGLIPAKYAGIAVVAQNVALTVQRGVLKVKHSKQVTEVLESANPLETLADVLQLDPTDEPLVALDPTDEPEPTPVDDEPTRLADQLA